MSACGYQFVGCGIGVNLFDNSSISQATSALVTVGADAQRSLPFVYFPQSNSLFPGWWFTCSISLCKMCFVNLGLQRIVIFYLLRKDRVLSHCVAVLHRLFTDPSAVVKGFSWCAVIISKGPNSVGRWLIAGLMRMQRTLKWLLSSSMRPGKPMEFRT